MTFTKMLIFSVWISMKSSFEQVSITRPITVSFSSIFFMLDLGERSFHIVLISNFIYSLSFIQGWLLFIKEVTYVKSLYFNSLSVFNSEPLCTWENQSSDKENIIIYYLFTFGPRVWLVIQQRLWFLTFTPGVCTTWGWLFLTAPTCHFKFKKNHFHSRSENDVFFNF